MNNKIFMTEADRSLFNFLFKYFFKTKVGPIISLVFPIIFMIMYIIINAMKNAELSSGEHKSYIYFVSGFPTYLVLSIIPLSFITLTQTMVELKNSILLRKIKTSGFTKTRYIMFTYIQYFFFSWCSVLITMVFFFSILNVHVRTDMNNVNWGNLFYAIFMLIISSNAFGIMLGSFFKSAMVTQLFGVCMLFIVMAFGGLFMPVSVIGDVIPIKIVSMLLPTNYAINLIMNCTFVSPQWYLNSMSNFIMAGELLNESVKGSQSLLTGVQPGGDIKNLIVFISNHNWTSESIKNPNNLGFNMFDMNHPLYYVESSYNFRFLNSGFNWDNIINGTDKAPLISLTLNTVEIFPIWQKIMNLVMAPVCTVFMIGFGLYKFSWYGR